MSVETVQIIALILFVLSGTFFVVAICLFFAWNIPGIIGNLTGITAKRAIKNINAKNEEEDKERVNYFRLMKSKRTENISGSGNIGRASGSLRQGRNTRKLGKVWEKTASLGKKNQNETVRLDMVEVRETTILSTGMEDVVLVQCTGKLPTFSVDVDIILCESAEAIE